MDAIQYRVSLKDFEFILLILLILSQISTNELQTGFTESTE